MKPSDREALRHLIEYARMEAETQKQSLTAYLLELAGASIEQSDVAVREFPARNRRHADTDTGLQ